MRTGEAADESLEADDPDIRAADGHDAALALQQLYAAAAQHLRLIAMPVVVTEHAEDRQVNTTAGVGQDPGLGRTTVGRQIAAQQQEIGLLGHPSHSGGHHVTHLLMAVHVAHRSNTNRNLAGPGLGGRVWPSAGASNISDR